MPNAMNIVANVVKVNSRLVGCSRARKLLSCEASEIGHCVFQPLYKNRDDVLGLALRNPRDGNTTLWKVVETKLDADNDVMFWRLEPIEETTESQPQVKGWSWIIYND